MARVGAHGSLSSPYSLHKSRGLTNDGTSQSAVLAFFHVLEVKSVLLKRLEDAGALPAVPKSQVAFLPSPQSPTTKRMLFAAWACQPKALRTQGVLLSTGFVNCGTLPRPASKRCD